MHPFFALFASSPSSTVRRRRSPPPAIRSMAPRISSRQLRAYRAQIEPEDRATFDNLPREEQRSILQQLLSEGNAAVGAGWRWMPRLGAAAVVLLGGLAVVAVAVAAAIAAIFTPAPIPPQTYRPYIPGTALNQTIQWGRDLAASACAPPADQPFVVHKLSRGARLALDHLDHVNHAFVSFWGYVPAHATARDQYARLTELQKTMLVVKLKLGRFDGHVSSGLLSASIIINDTTRRAELIASRPPEDFTPPALRRAGNWLHDALIARAFDTAPFPTLHESQMLAVWVAVCEGQSRLHAIAQDLLQSAASAQLILSPVQQEFTAVYNFLYPEITHRERELAEQRLALINKHQQASDEWYKSSWANRWAVSEMLIRRVIGKVACGRAARPFDQTLLERPEALSQQLEGFEAHLGLVKSHLQLVDGALAKLEADMRPLREGPQAVFSPCLHGKPNVTVLRNSLDPPGEHVSRLGGFWTHFTVTMRNFDTMTFEELTVANILHNATQHSRAAFEELYE